MTRKFEPAEPYVPYTEVKKLPKNFPLLVQRHRDLSEEIQERETEKKELSIQICAALVAAKQKRVEVDNIWVRQQDNVNRRIDAKLLLAAGVPAKTINAATVETRTPYALTQYKPEPTPLVGGEE